MRTGILKVLFFEVKKKKFGNKLFDEGVSKSEQKPSIQHGTSFFKGPLAPLAAHTWNLPAPPTGSLWGLQAPSA